MARSDRAGVPNIFGKKSSGNSSTGSSSKGSSQFSFSSLLFTIISILVIAYVLMGGINQRKFVKGVFDMAKTIGLTLSGQSENALDMIEVNEDGVYIKP